MRISFLIALIILLCNSLQAQENYEIVLSSESFDVKEGYFFINEIIDDREDKTNIGMVREGVFNKNSIALIQGELADQLLKKLEAGLVREYDFIPLTMKVNQFSISEKNANGLEVCVFDLDTKFLLNDEVIFKYNDASFTSTPDAIKKHGDNIHTGLENCFQKLSKVMLQKGLYNALPFKYGTVDDVVDKDDYSEGSASTTEDSKDDISSVNDRNVNAVGYQIGGLTLLGYDYTVRVSDVFGLHFGAGLAGYTVGIKLHTKPEKKSSFFNLSFKDAGFGLLQGAGLEYGGQLFSLSKKSDLGLHAQVGVLGILAIDRGFETQLFGLQGAPDATLALGVGLSC